MKDPRRVAVVVGVDGMGRSHRLAQLADAAGLPAVWVRDAEPLESLRRRVEAAGDALVLVDDPHRLPGELLGWLARAARAGAAVALARRPSIPSPELAELDEAAAAQGTVERLEPLDAAAVAGVLADPGERAAERAAGLLAATAGVPALVVLAAQQGPAAVAARVHRQLARAAPSTRAVAKVLALGVALADEALATAAGVEPAAIVPAMRELHDCGLLAPAAGAPALAAGALIPVVAKALLSELPLAEQRGLHDAVGRVLLADGGDPVAAAGQLSRAGASSSAAAAAYLAAGDRLRFAEPEAAAGWYDRALASGADPQRLAAGRAEAAALLGLPVDPDAGAQAPDDRRRLALVHAAVAAHQGRQDRAADGLLAAGPPGPALAVPVLVSVGRIAEAQAADLADAPHSIRLHAAAALAVDDPQRAVPLLIEAAEVAEHARPDVVLPDTPHALAAVVAVAAGDVATAERLLATGARDSPTGARDSRAGARDSRMTGGPAAAVRHRLLLAWARMRAGRQEAAAAELPALAAMELGGRERLLVAVLSAGLARRSGDAGQLRTAWAAAEQVLARQAVDLLQVEALEELLVAAARLRQHERVSTVLDLLDGMLDRWGRPPAWAVALGWVRLQVAVATEDADAAEAAAAALGKLQPTGRRQRAQCAAAKPWAEALAGRVDEEQVLAVAEELAAVQLPWEASRLTGQAAIRTAEPAVARRLLERARELANPEVKAAADGKPAQRGQLSERELEVSRLVLAGRTHREIGAQLYVSPKTVEHHVARIRTKLGATSRAELQAALRQIITDSD